MSLLAALWGASYLFIKVSLDDGLDPVFIVFARIALGALVLVAIAMRAGILAQMRPLIGPITILAVVQVVLPFVLITFGEQHISSALTGILVSAAPIFTALIAARFDDDERPHGIATAGVVMGMVGVVLLFGFDLTGDAQALAGGLMVLLAAAGYAVGSLYLKHRVRGVAPVGVAAATMVAGTIVLLPFALFTLPAQTPDLQTIGAMVALGAGGTGIAFAIYFTLIAEIGPGRASLVAYIAPGFAVFYGVTLLGEPLTLGAILGLVLILAGSWVAAEGRWPGRSRATPALPLEPPPPVREPVPYPPLSLLTLSSSPPSPNHPPPHVRALPNQTCANPTLLTYPELHTHDSHVNRNRIVRPDQEPIVRHGAGVPRFRRSRVAAEHESRARSRCPSL